MVIFQMIRTWISRIIILLLSIYLIVFIPVLWNYYPLIIVSGSMEPTLRVGGILYYHPKKIETFKKDEILVFRTKKHIISHRIINTSTNSFITKGDANKNNDSTKVLPKQIIGQGTNFSIPFIGYYVDFIYNHKYLLLMISLSLFLSLYRKEMVRRNE